MSGPIQSAAIVTRVREVLEQSAGALRQVPSGAYEGDYPDGLDESARERRALETPRVRATFALTGPSPFSPPTNGNLIMYDATIGVVVERTVTRETQLDPDAYAATQAAALADTDVVRQAIEYPGNLTATNAGDLTDIVSGCARLMSSSVSIAGLVDTGAQLITSTMAFAAKVIARPAIS